MWKWVWKQEKMQMVLLLRRLKVNKNRKVGASSFVCMKENITATHNTEATGQNCYKATGSNCHNHGRHVAKKDKNGEERNGK